MPKKTKAQLEEERLQREEEERKAKLIEEKRLAEETEKKRLEDIRIKEERRVFREGELLRLRDEQRALFDMERTREQQLQAEEDYDVRFLSFFFRSFHSSSSSCYFNLSISLLLFHFRHEEKNGKHIVILLIVQEI